MTREIVFTIDPKTGQMTSDFVGVIGPDCDVASKVIEAELGVASDTQIKPEDYYRTTVRNQSRVGKH
jgi:hypothetical protein